MTTRQITWTGRDGEGNVVSGTVPVNVAAPVVGALPAPQTTGYLHTGTTLTPYTGPKVITAPNVVIEDKLITTDIEFSNAANLTLRRCKVHSGSGGTGGYGNVNVHGSSWGLIEDVEISCDPTRQYDRSIQTISRAGSATKKLTIRRVYAHGGFRGMDITSSGYIDMYDCYMGYNSNPGSGERSHASAIRAAGGVSYCTFTNCFFGVGAQSLGSGLIATYPENGANHHLTFTGGLWDLQDQGGGAPYGIACGYTIGSEQQNHDYTITDLYVSTAFYSGGCPGGVGQHWKSGDSRIGALGGTNLWSNVRKYHPGYADHNQQIAAS